jgi:Sec-independent protein translocase protein TatA
MDDQQISDWILVLAVAMIVFIAALQGIRAIF